MQEKQAADWRPNSHVAGVPAEFDLRSLGIALYEFRWPGLFILILSIVCGVCYLIVTPLTYRADSLLQLDEKAKGLAAFAELSDPFQEGSNLPSAIEILRSRAVLGAVVEDLALDLIAQPKLFPLLGRPVFRRKRETAQLSDPWFGWARYAWGGERIALAQLDVPSSLLSRPFTLIAGEEGRYTLYDADDRVMLDGSVGHLQESEGVRLQVSELDANAGTHFYLMKLHPLDAIGRLSAGLKVEEPATSNDTDRKAGLLRISLEGSDPRQIAITVNKIAEAFVGENAQRKTAQTRKALALLEDQIKLAKRRLENSEKEFNAFRLQQRSVDLKQETSSILERIIDVEEQLAKLSRTRQEVSLKFTANHSKVIGLDAQIASLRKELNSLRQRIKALPEIQQEILRLSRAVEVNDKLYALMLNRAQELEVIQAGAVGNVFVLDEAIAPYKPTRPRKKLVLALFVVLGIMASVAIALFRRTMREGVDDPEVLERQLGLPIYATIPYSKAQKKISKSAAVGSGGTALLAVEKPDEMAIESLRTLRTALSIATLGARNNAILVTASGPGVGKSFVCANLGVVLASAANRVLLVDADFRRGRLQQYFGHSSAPDLEVFLQGVVSFEETIQHTAIHGLDLVASGTEARFPSELLTQPLLGRVFESMSKRYDYVLIDSPPVLGVTDAAVIGRLCGATLVVAKSGAHSLREMNECIKRLTQADVTVRGVIFNGVDIRRPVYGYGKYYGCDHKSLKRRAPSTPGLCSGKSPSKGSSYLSQT